MLLLTVCTKPSFIVNQNRNVTSFPGRWRSQPGIWGRGVWFCVYVGRGEGVKLEKPLFDEILRRGPDPRNVLWTRPETVLPLDSLPRITQNESSFQWTAEKMSVVLAIFQSAGKNENKIFIIEQFRNFRFEKSAPSFSFCIFYQTSSSRNTNLWLFSNKQVSTKTPVDLLCCASRLSIRWKFS